MLYPLSAVLSTLGLLIALFICLEIGWRVGAHRITSDPEGAQTSTAAVQGVVFGLLGLLRAFTFGGAASRFDPRRQLIIEETNNIGTAYLRLDLLPADTQPALRENFRRYVDTRLEVYRKLPDMAAAYKELAKAEWLQRDIWRQSVAASQAPGAARLEHDDRYYNDPHLGSANTSAASHLCHVVWTGDSKRFSRGLRHGRQQAAQLVA